MTRTDFTFYESAYNGNVIPFSLYEKYEMMARTKVDILTLRRIKEMDDSVRRAVCAVADYLYVKNNDKVEDIELFDIMMQYLDMNYITRAL